MLAEPPRAEALEVASALPEPDTMAFVLASAKPSTTGSTNAYASTTATSVDGNATATTTATASGTGSADASTSAYSLGGSASVNRSAVADSAGSGSADATSRAEVRNMAGGQATAGLGVFNSDGPQDLTFRLVAAGSGVGNPGIEVNNLPLITTGSGAPGGTFVSLFYLDTTAVTGGCYLWDFVTGAYVKISSAVS